MSPPEHKNAHLERNASDRKMPSKDADKHRAAKREETREERKDANRDPVTNAPGAHPVGTGVGAAGGAAAGAAVGALGGPIGSMAGGIVGALLGGLGGKAAAEAIDPTHEHKYWQDNFRDRDYVSDDAEYGRYGPAYQYGWESYCARAQRGERCDFDAAEPDLARDWNKHRTEDDLRWEEARPATRDAWERTHTEHASKFEHSR